VQAWNATTEKFEEGEQQIARSSVMKNLRALSVLYNDLKHWCRIKAVKPLKLPVENPVTTLRKEKRGWFDETGFRRTRVVTDEEVGIFFNIASPRVKRVFMAALNTALRKGDLFALDAEKKDAYWNRLRGIQSKILSEYVLPANPEVDRILAEGGLDDTNFRREWDAAMAEFIRQGHEKFTVRDCRRTAAIAVWEATRDIRICQALLGHKSQMTTEVYLGIKRADLDKAGEALAARYKTPSVELRVVR
jgi:integrase